MAVRMDTGRSIRTAGVVLGTIVAALIAACALLYILIDADAVVRFAQWRVKAETGRTLTVEGPARLKKGLRPRLHVEDVSVDNASWAERPAMLTADSVDVQIELLSLVFGPLRVDEAVFDSPKLWLERSDSGEANWTLERRRPSKEQSFPQFGVLRISNGELYYRGPPGDRPVDLAIDKLISSPEGSTVKTNAHGTYQGDEFVLAVAAAPWEELARKENPFAVSLKLDLGEFKLAAKGSAKEPLRLKGLNANADVAGPDLGALYKYSGIALPTTPPFDFSGLLVEDGRRWTFRNFKGALGESTLHGTLSLSVDGEKPALSGEVRSPHLRMVDIAGLFGLDPARFDPAAEQPDDPAPILSDAPLQFQKFNAMNADITLVADTATARNSIFDAIDARILLKDGVARFAPFNFKSGGGSVRLALTLDGRAKPAKVDLAADVERMPLSRLIGDRNLDEAAGPVSGVIAVEGEGISMKEFADDANGEAVLYMGGGKISHLLIEVLGLDVAETLGIILTEDDLLPVRCGVVHFAVNDGVLGARSVFLDTTDTLVAAEGSIDLGAESAALRLKPHPKDWSLFSLKTAIAIEGPLADLAIFPDPLKVGAEGAIKKAANAVVTTVVGLLPPIDVGEEENVDCGKAIASAKAAVAAARER